MQVKLLFSPVLMLALPISVFAQNQEGLVTLYGAKSISQVMDDKACQVMNGTFNNVRKSGGVYLNLDKNKNPSFGQGKNFIKLSLAGGRSLYVGTTSTTFDYKGKRYEFTTHWSSVAKKHQREIHGVWDNKYCAGYFVEKAVK